MRSDLGVGRLQGANIADSLPSFMKIYCLIFFRPLGIGIFLIVDSKCWQMPSFFLLFGVTE